MKIGVISDTHIKSPDKLLPNEVFKAFEGVELILHAGDILIDEVLLQLEAIAPVEAVSGNNDSYEIYKKHGTRKLITVGGKKIGMTHGVSRGKTYMNAYGEFIEDDVDCIVYGHSHISHNEMINNILFFNPGSATQRRFQPRHSVGILHIHQNIVGEIIYFD
jgi:putative phosphoesterase